MLHDEIEVRAQKSKDILMQKSGAHYVADSILDLPVIFEDINKRLANGESP